MHVYLPYVAEACPAPLDALPTGPPSVDVVAMPPYVKKVNSSFAFISLIAYYMSIDNNEFIVR